MGDWIYVPKWSKYQHYKNRRPTWIKLYLDLRDRDSWRALSLADRGLLSTIWVEFAAVGPIKVESLRRTFGKKVSPEALKRLNDAGFIEFAASSVLATREEKKEEGKTFHQNEQPDNPNHEPPRDPEAAAMIRALAAKLGPR